MVIKTCEDCIHDNIDYYDTESDSLHSCNLMKVHLYGNYPKIPKECTLENYKDPKIQYQD